MGLDIYAGTLTRYYTHNWKTAVQQWAEENGYTFSRLTPDGRQIEEEETDPEEVRAAMENWRDQVLAAVGQGREPYLPWTEDNERPYYTDKPDWDAFEALLLYGACQIYGVPVPPVFQKNGRFEDYPVSGQVEADKDMNWSLYAGATWWLPFEDCFLLRGPLPTGEGGIFATSGALLAELKKINELGWQADEETILGWTATEGYPTDIQLAEDGLPDRQDIPEHTNYATESLAKFAFSIFWRAARYSLEQRVPVLMDF